MTLRHLTIFRAVCQTESITLAAEHLNMTQPAVSLAVRELEDFYGVQLFERMNRRIYITEAGRTLLQYADTILSQYAEWPGNVFYSLIPQTDSYSSCKSYTSIAPSPLISAAFRKSAADRPPDALPVTR